MQPGDSRETEWDDQAYLVTRGLDKDILWTVWSDNKDRPYNVRQGKGRSQLICDCPDYVYRGKVRPCKHVAMIRRLRV